MKAILMTLVVLGFAPTTFAAPAKGLPRVTCVEDLRAADGPLTKLVLTPTGPVFGYTAVVTRKGNSFGQAYSSEKQLEVNTCGVEVSKKGTLLSAGCSANDIGMILGPKSFDELRIHPHAEKGYYIVDAKHIEVDEDPKAPADADPFNSYLSSEQKIPVSIHEAMPCTVDYVQF